MKTRSGDTPIQLPDLIKSGDPITAKWANSIRSALQRLRDRAPSTTSGAAQRKSKPPFWSTLRRMSDGTLKLFMEDGYVVLRKNRGEDAMATILPSDIPDDLTVEIGDKFTLKIEEDTWGEFSTASVVKTSGAWPASTAPDLDAESASGGVRHIRLCEITTIDDQPDVRIWLTGHVDHFAPTKIVNAEASGSSILKGYADGKWTMRQLTEGDGITITEGADGIEIAAGESDGWWGTLSWLFYSGGDVDNLVLTLERGAVKTVSLNGVDVPGTQGTPGDAELEVEF
jgi:hypothetical protein